MRPRSVVLAAAIVVAAAALPLAPAAASAATTTVSLTFDDGRETSYDGGRAVLQANDVNGTFYVNTGNLDHRGFMTSTQLRRLAQDGDDIGGHTVDHPELPDLPHDQAVQEVCQDRENLQQLGISAPASFAYPYGNVGIPQSIIEKIPEDCGYSSGRIAGDVPVGCTSPTSESLPPAKPYEIRVTDTLASVLTASQLEALVTCAQSHGGGWVPIMLHDVCSQPGSPTPEWPLAETCGDNAYEPISPSELDTFIKWVKAQPDANFRTVSDVIDDDTPHTDAAIACNAGGAQPCGGDGPQHGATVTLTRRDDHPGVTRYTTDGSVPTDASPVASGPIALPNTTTLQYRSFWTDPSGVDRVEAAQRTIVNVVPTTTIDAGPSGLINNPTPTFSFSSVDPGATFTCQVDAEGYAPCASPYTTAALADGGHTLSVRATDAGGNTNVATRSFAVDATGPDTAITSGPSGVTGPDAQVVAFAADEPSTYECALDDGPWSTCASPVTIPAGLPDGSHTFAIRATDHLGNQQVVTVRWTVQRPGDGGSSGPAPGGTGTPPTPASGTASGPSGAAGLKVAVPKTRLSLRDALRKGLRVRVFALAGSHVRLIAKARSRAADVSRGNVLASTTVRFDATATKVIRLKFSRRGRHALAHKRRFSLAIQATSAPWGGSGSRGVANATVVLGR